MLSIGDALAKCFDLFAKGERFEEVLLSSLLSDPGRYCAEEIFATAPLPPFSSSAMDGYALAARHASIENTTLQVVGTSKAGAPYQGECSEGQCVRIFTGAMIPSSCDAVLAQEDAIRSKNSVTFSVAATPAKHVRQHASDVAVGDLVASVSDELTPARIALIASQHRNSVRCFVKPKVALLCTGDELVDSGSEMHPGQIVNTNKYSLHAAITQAGAEVLSIADVRDSAEQIQHALRSGLQGADLLISTGGVSVGDHDLVRDAMEALGIDLGFWRVKMKPGKPIAAGHYHQTPVIALPGNPVSALVGFELFARPGIRHMLGDPAPFASFAAMQIDGQAPRIGSRPEFVRVCTDQEGSHCRVLANQSSGALSGIAPANALLFMSGSGGSTHPGLFLGTSGRRLHDIQRAVSEELSGSFK